MHPRNHKLVNRAKELRKNMTKEERRLWFAFLREYPIRFRRQEIIGNYIADFYCSSAKLIIELDGSQHCEEENVRYDAERSRFFQSLGLRVLRFSNLDVMRNFEGVCERIMEALRETPQSASLTAPLSGEPSPSVSFADSSPFRGASRKAAGGVKRQK